MTKDLTVCLQADDYFENYYLKIKTPCNSTKIARPTKASAKAAYLYYLDKGREVIWLGKWNGHSFEDTTIEMNQVD